MNRSSENFIIKHIEEIFQIYFTKLNNPIKYFMFCAIDKKQDITFTLSKPLLLSDYSLSDTKHFKFKHINDNEFEVNFFHHIRTVKVDFDSIVNNIHQYLHHIAILLEHEEVLYQRAKRANEILDDLYCACGTSGYYEKLDNLIEILHTEIIS